MISKALGHINHLVSYMMVIFLLILSACSTTLPEIPICVPDREFVLESLSRDEQLSIGENVSLKTLQKIATNDQDLKDHVVLLETLIRAHDEPLGDCP